MPPRNWKQETRPGHGLRRSQRTKVISFDLAAEVRQLWNALAIHHGRPLNGLAPWAIAELAKHGVKVGKRPPEMGTGLRKPKAKYLSANKYSPEEKVLWAELKGEHGCGWAGVLTLALIELYWREPVVLANGNLPQVRRRQRDYFEGDGGEEALEGAEDLAGTRQHHLRSFGE
jgi:hypothetical protein